MPIPDPATFIGQKCTFRLKSKRRVTKKVLKIDTTGVIVEDADGGHRLYRFAEIDNVALAKQQ